MTTIRDVAKLAGVSPITVSRVVNGLDTVNLETRARVERAIEELSYVRNLAARSLRSRETYTLALLLPDVTNTFWTTVARGVEDAALSGGYSVLLCNTDENPDKFTKYLNTVIQQRVDGVLVAPVSNSSKQLSQLGTRQVPTVVLDRRVSGWDGDSVYCDSIAGAEALVQHLLSLGHTRIAIISGPGTTSTAEDRVAGYCLALCKAGLPIDERLIWRGEYRASSGRAMTRELLNAGLAPSAIFATNNAIAAGVLEELKNQGKSVPGDIAVVCFDEVLELERFFPFLTSVSQPAYDMGINATQLLLSRINTNTPLRARQVVLPTRLILRYSCGRFLKTGGSESLAHFTLLRDLSTNHLVMPLDDSDREMLLTCVPGYVQDSNTSALNASAARPDRDRLIKALAFQKTDRRPYLDIRGAGKRVFEYVLGRTLRYAADGHNILPEDAIQFAQQTGIDAVAAEITWPLGTISHNPGEDLALKIRRVFLPPALASQLSLLENLLTASDDSGVGVYARFGSFFETTLQVFQAPDNIQFSNTDFLTNASFEKIMDMFSKHQERVMRALCDRFGQNLCFVAIQDDFLAESNIITSGLFEKMILPRLQRMITPALEHALPVVLITRNVDENALPGLYGIGVRAVYSDHFDASIINHLAHSWSGKLAFVGGLPLSILSGSEAEIERQIRENSAALSGFAGIILSLDGRVLEKDNIPPKNFLAMLRAIQRSSRS